MNEIGQDRRTARELTEEIDRETDGEVFAGTDARAHEGRRELDESGPELAVDGSRQGWVGGRRELAGGRGNKILAYGAGRRRENERVQEIAEIDNGYGVESRPGVTTVGEESGLQIAERRAWDAENIRNEIDPKRDYEAQIMAKDQNAIAQDVAGRVDAIVRQREFRPGELEALRMRASKSMLEAYENPYILGKRN